MSRTGHHRYRTNRARIRNQDMCWICGQWIDPELTAPHPKSWTADHINPVGNGGSNNGQLAPAHRDCNIRRGKADKRPARHGRTW